MEFTKSLSKTYNTRESGIELLKIIAILLIVVFHVTMSMEAANTELNELKSRLLDFRTATMDIEQFLLACLYNLGSIGNDIFFVCSFWFLCDSKTIKINKVFTIIMDAWLISVFFFNGYYLLSGEYIGKDLAIESALPTLFGINWFITCYLLIYLIHPLLNTIIDSVDQRVHALSCIIAFILYFIISFTFSFIKRDMLFANYPILFITIYFIIAYIKKYMSKWSESVSANIKLLMVGIIGTLSLMIIIDLLGLKHICQFDDKLIYFCTNSNPFYLFTAIGMFNLFRKLKFHNSFINSISGLSIFIYLIHENLYFRYFTRPRICAYLLEKYGRNNALICD
ncbi:acyltransferase family protein [Lachnospiraceae bacterium C1.1]|nr:acyltransferase family protein [Lachnospiraceae bacterium C1.1]